MKYDDKSSPSIEVLDLDVRTFNALKRAGINTIADIESQAVQLESKIPSKYKIVMDKLSEYKGIPAIGSWVEKDMLGDELTFEEITNMVGELIVMDMSTESHERYKVERVEAIIDGSDGKRHLRTYDGSKQRGMVNEIFFDKKSHRPERAWRLKTNTPAALPSPVQSETAVAAFDYSELDADTAAKLENVTAEIFNVRKEYIFTMAKKVAYAHDLLANHYGGKFGVWCESIGISRDTGNNLVRVAEIFGNISAEEQKNLSQLKPSLLYEAARPSAPPELVEQVKSGDITTHKEYIALKKQLDEANKKLEDAKFHSKQQSESFDRVSEQSSVNYHKYIDEMHKNQDLMKQIRELESRPVEATFTDNSEELEKKDKEISELKEEIDRLSDRSVKVFTIRLTIDEYEKLFGIVKESNDFVLMEAVKKAQIIRL